MPRKILKANLDDAALHRFGTEIPQTISEFHSLLTILKAFGVVAAYQQLQSPEIMPESCLKMASRSLDLMAFHGDKWLFEPWFASHLERLRLRHGKVRFLLSETSNNKTRMRCKELILLYPKVFLARIFDETPIFRTLIIDDTYLLLGHYGYDVIEQDGLNSVGWKSPQLFIKDNKQWSLLIPFRELFRLNWDRSQDIVDSVDEIPPNIVKRDFQPSQREL